MENGSRPRSAAGDPAQNGNLPLSARLLGAGVRGARTVTRATGIDRAVEVAAEEAIVAAVESQAVERAMARVLEGPIVEDAVEGALRSETVKRALVEAMDSELVDEVWRRFLASDEAQKLVERIAEAPEVRAAISAQGRGLLDDIGRTVGNLARRLDDSFERLARRLLFRRQRLEPTDRAGAISRAVAMAIDGAFVNLAFTAFAALVTLLGNAFGHAEAARLLRSPSVPPPGSPSAPSISSPSGRWRGRRRGCASSESISTSSGCRCGAASSASSGSASPFSASASASSGSSSAPSAGAGTTASPGPRSSMTTAAPRRRPGRRSPPAPLFLRSPVAT